MSNYVLIPCAGSGSRFGSAIPKQYTKIGDKTVIEHTLNAFLQIPEIIEIVVIVSKDDIEIDKYALISPKIKVARVGSDTRAKTVLNGLNLLKCEANDWVLVHDAARCCISPQAIKNMLVKLSEDKIGGILAIPVSDTLKHGNNGLITKTVDRNNLYHAQTPQMFRYNVLHKALSGCDLSVTTDDASAVEALGLPVHLVLGEVSNIKLTYPSDIKLAEFYLGAKC
jgi:2-C-methyl-D-erythritol 4-phosphate cytidylyltransferase